MNDEWNLDEAVSPVAASFQARLNPSQDDAHATIGTVTIVETR